MSLRQGRNERNDRRLDPSPEPTQPRRPAPTWRSWFETGGLLGCLCSPPIRIAVYRRQAGLPLRGQPTTRDQSLLSSLDCPSHLRSTVSDQRLPTPEAPREMV